MNRFNFRHTLPKVLVEQNGSIIRQTQMHQRRANMREVKNMQDLEEFIRENEDLIQKITPVNPSITKDDEWWDEDCWDEDFGGDEKKEVNRK